MWSYCATVLSYCGILRSYVWSYGDTESSCDDNVWSHIGVVRSFGGIVVLKEPVVLQ